MTVDLKQRVSGLRQECLSYPEILAQSVGYIAPVAMVSVTTPLVFATAGKGTWLAYLIATVGLVLVSFNIKHFARRSASCGALYTYIAMGMGPMAGVISGWCILLAYLGAASNALVGFAISANIVLSSLGFHFPTLLLYAFCCGLAWFYAYTDIQLSTVLMLVLELTSVTLILILAACVLFTHGVAIDSSQLTLSGVTPSGFGLGMVLAVFCYIGFESCATLGEEAKKPLRYIPRAMSWSLVSVGVFFIFLSYTEVLGFTGYQTSLAQSNEPLAILAQLAGVEWLGILISVGIAFSFFVCTLAATNAGGRIFYTMARHTVFHRLLGEAHAENKTPHIAVSFSILLVLLFPAIMSLSGISLLDAYGYSGTITTYGFLFVYILVSIAAPMYLDQLGILRTKNVVTAILAVLFMAIPVIGSVYPVPKPPYNLFPYLFLAYLLVGGCWFWQLRLSSPQTIQEIEYDLEALHKKFR